MKKIWRPQQQAVAPVAKMSPTGITPQAAKTTKKSQAAVTPTKPPTIPKPPSLNPKSNQQKKQKSKRSKHPKFVQATTTSRPASLLPTQPPPPQPTSTTDPPNLPNPGKLWSDILKPPPPKRQTQTTIPRPDRNNNQLGPDPTFPPDESLLQLFYKNPNGIVKSFDRDKCDEWKEAANIAKLYQYNIQGYAETNYKFNPNRSWTLTQKLRNECPNSVIQTSNSIEPSATTYLPGGTLTAVDGSLAPRIIDKGQDPSNLGRWSQISLRRDNMTPLHILTAYRVCRKAKGAIQSAYMQQYRLLRLAGSNAEPRKQCLLDLAKHIKSLRDKNDSVLLMIDANEGPKGRDGLNDFITTTGLVDIIRHTLKVTRETQINGSEQIEYIFASPDLLNAVISVTMFPFNVGPFPNSDHCGMLASFHRATLLGTETPRMSRMQQRNLQSTRPNIVARYIKLLGRFCQKDNIPSRQEALSKIPTSEWTDDHSILLDALDQNLLARALQAESHCGYPTDCPWSPQLHAAYRIFQYWKLRRSQERTKRVSPDRANRESEITKIIASIPVFQVDVPNELTIWTTASHIGVKSATKYLRQVRASAEQLRLEFLATAKELALLRNDEKKGNILTQIQNAEERTQTFKLLALYVNPEEGKSLKEISVPTNPQDDPRDSKTTNWTTITQKAAIETRIHDWTRQHFRQAINTPFLQEPLKSLVGFDGLTTFADRVYKGTADLSIFPQRTQELLREMKAKAPALPLIEPTNEVIKHGYKIWPERTQTSPSGKHLGHYKSLFAPMPPTATFDKNAPTQEQLFNLTCELYRLAIRHCHPFSRWETVWNYWSRKLWNDIRIHRHRCLHLGEADKNLSQKKYVAKDLMQYAEQNGTIADETHGGRCNRQAIDVAWSVVLIISQIHHDHLPAAINFKDLTACYDRNVEATSNMSLRSHGCPKHILQMHAKFKRSARYFLVTSHGVSELFNDYTEDDPFIGSGQGDGDSGSRWIVVSTEVINAYKKHATPFEFRHPIQSKSLKFYVAAFVDDTYSSANAKTTDLLHRIITENTQLWADYIHVTGGKLELSKSECFVYEWHCDDNGAYSINDASFDLSVRDNETTMLTKMKTMKITDSYKHMGIHQTGDMSNDAQFAAVKLKSDTYVEGFHRSPISGPQAFLSYKCSYAPKVHYSLPIDTFSETQCSQISSKAINAFLPKMGLNRHFPRPVVWAPNHFGGLDFAPKYNVSGMGKVKLILRHVRSESTIGKQFMNLLANYQLRIGTAISVLADHRNFPHSIHPWIEALREYLRSINGMIHLANHWTPAAQRSNDSTIMDILLEKAAPKVLEILNHCRLYLQITYVSDLVDDDGKLLPGACGELDPTTNCPRLHGLSITRLHWPVQQRPGPKAIKLWKTYLQHIPRCKPGPWLPTHSMERQWMAYYDPDSTNLLLFLPADASYSIHARTKQTRRTISFAPFPTGTTNDLPPNATPTNHHNFIIPTPTQRHKPAPIAEIIYDPYDPNPILQNIEPWLLQMFRTHHGPIIRFQKLLWESQVAFFCGGYHYRYGTIYVSVQSKLYQLAEFGGTAPSTLTSSSPTRSRLAAILASLVYIEQVSTHYKFAHPNQVRIIVDEASIITRINKHRASDYIPPTTNHYDLYSEIHHRLKRLSLPDCELHAFVISKKNKGHEGEPKHSLYYLRKRAATLHTDLLRPIQPPPTSPHNPAAWSIGGDLLHCKLEFLSHSAYATPALRAFLCNKYDWRAHVPSTIDWYPHGRAIANLSYASRNRIIKFIHGWLPTNKHMNRIDPTIPEFCVACNDTIETCQHIIWCPHPDRQQCRDDLKEELEKYLKGSAKKMSEILLKGLFVWSTDPPVTSPAADYPRKYRIAIEQQHTIGWDQLWYGRLSTTWGDLVSAERVRRLKGLHPDIWAQFLIRRIWNGVEKIWSARNSLQHKADDVDPTTTQRLKFQIEKIYADAINLPEPDQLPFDVDSESIMKLPRQQQQVWIEIHSQFIATQSYKAAERAQRGVQDIRSFFTRTTRPTPGKAKSDDKPP